MTTLSSSWQLIASNGLTYGTLKIYAYATQSGNQSTVHTLLRITVSQWYSANRVRAGITGGNNYYYNNNSSPKAFAIGDHDLIEGSYTVNHNANGSASTTISYWLDQSFGGSAYSDTSPGSVTVDLPSTKPAAGDATGITINASPTYNSVTLSFSGGTPGSGASISYYRVKGLGYSNYTKVSNPVTITGLTPNTSYTFTVDFVDNYGTEASKSTSKTFTTLKPAAPSKGTITVSSITYNSITYSWSRFSFGAGATWGEYQISFNGGAWTSVGTNTSYTASNLSPSTSYTLNVRLKDNYDQYSGESSVTGTTTETSAPTAGTILVKNITHRGATLLWSGFTFGSGADFGKYQYNYNGFWIDCGADTTVTLKNLSSNASYTFKVRLIDNYGTASNSVSITFKTKSEESWKYVNQYIKVNGTWKYGIVYYKENGVWKIVTGTYFKGQTPTVILVDSNGSILTDSNRIVLNAIQ